jgi:hypothetical protein
MKGDHLTLTAFVNYYGVDLMLYSPAIEHPVLIQSRKNVAQPKTLQLLVLADHYRSLVSLKEVLLRNKLEAFRTQTMLKLMNNQESEPSEDSYSSRSIDLQFRHKGRSNNPTWCRGSAYPPVTRVTRVRFPVLEILFFFAFALFLFVPQVMT